MWAPGVWVPNLGSGVHKMSVIFEEHTCDPIIGPSTWNNVYVTSHCPCWGMFVASIAERGARSDAVVDPVGPTRGQFPA